MGSPLLFVIGIRVVITWSEEGRLRDAVVAIWFFFGISGTLLSDVAAGVYIAGSSVKA